MRFFNAGVVAAVLWCASAAGAAEQRVCGTGLTVVKAAVGQAVEIFVEAGVGDLVRSGDPSTLKVEHSAGHLFLTPLGDAPAEVTVIDRQGQSHLIRCVLGQPVDRKIVIGDCPPVDGVEKSQDAVMALMRALIRARVPTGASEKRLDEVLFDDGKVRMRSVAIYQMPRLWGYVMRIENLTSKAVTVPIQQMAFPGLLAVSSMKDVLSAREQSYVYMVVGR